MGEKRGACHGGFKGVGVDIGGLGGISRAVVVWGSCLNTRGMFVVVAAPR